MRPQAGENSDILSTTAFPQTSGMATARKASRIGELNKIIIQEI